jgi:hypothetical protein
MAGKKLEWKKGRGKLGIFKPLMGTWRAEADSPQGKVVCTRTFCYTLDGAYVQLTADWEYEGGSYKETALYGKGPDGKISFWSFTSDGKQSQGNLIDMSEVHPQAIAFEADMPAGKGRMIYWPDEEEGFHWVVDAKPKKNWSRMVEHHYLKVE